MPRGPLSHLQALAGLALALLAGGVCGALLRSRWAALVAPLVFAAVYEVARIGAVDPTVDAPRLSTLGITAFVLGRLFDALVLLLPMAFGASLGAVVARRRLSDVGATRPPARVPRLRRAATVTATVGLVAFAVVIGRPPATAPIVDADGGVVDGSIAELATVRIGGHDQVLMIRGQRADAPVLLWLAGGPGGSDIGPMRNLGQRLEHDFVVVTWDQRGSGRSYAALEPVDTMTFERAVADTLEVTDHLRDRFDTERIYLAANSWGTLPGVVAAQRHPERYHAYVGAGQMVSPLETDRLFYEDTLAYAREHGDDALEEQLLALGPPPYDDFLDYEVGVFGGEHLWNVYERPPGFGMEGEMPANVLAREFGLVAGIRSGGAAIDTLAVLYPKLQDVDLRTQATRLEVPVHLVQGRHEARGRAKLATEWFEQLEAPDKELIVFERSGHRPMFEEPERFAEVMAEVVLAGTTD